jgi:D-galactarolactone cycloisomerase
VLRLQSGETGPVSAAIAGVDIALWDIVGQRERLPLWKLLGGRCGSVSAYASTGRSHGFEPLLEEALTKGFRGFKMRCWGDPAQHIGAYEKARAMAGNGIEPGRRKARDRRHAGPGPVDRPLLARALAGAATCLVNRPGM